MPPATVVPTPGAISGIEEVDVEAHVHVGVLGESVERELHGPSHAHLVDGAHVEHRQLLLVDESPLAGIDAADADLADPLRLDGGRCAAELTSSGGPKPHRHATGMPCRLPLGLNSRVLKSAWASSQRTRSGRSVSRQ